MSIVYAIKLRADAGTYTHITAEKALRELQERLRKDHGIQITLKEI